MHFMHFLALAFRSEVVSFVAFSANFTKRRALTWFMFSWYKYLIVGLVFSRLGFWSGNLFLIAHFPDLCLLVPFYPHLPHICPVTVFCSTLLPGLFFVTFYLTFPSAANKDCNAFSCCVDVSAERHMSIAFWKVRSVSRCNLFRTVSFITPQTNKNEK